MYYFRDDEDLEWPEDERFTAPQIDEQSIKHYDSDELIVEVMDEHRYELRLVDPDLLREFVAQEEVEYYDESPPPFYTVKQVVLDEVIRILRTTPHKISPRGDCVYILKSAAEGLKSPAHQLRELEDLGFQVVRVDEAGDEIC